jgi:hypothetical protein
MTFYLENKSKQLKRKREGKRIYSLHNTVNNGIMALLQPTHEPVLCREKFIIKKIERVDTNKYCGYFFPCALIL